MESQKYIEEMRKIQDTLIDFIDDEGMNDESFKSLFDQLNKHLIIQDHHKFRTFFRILANISNNHHRCANFFEKIEKILFNIKSEIKKCFSNSELFEIFESNKRILLYLFDEKMLIMDDNIISNIINKKYYMYFAPELRSHTESIKKATVFLYDNTTIKEIMEELPENFYENRKRGENENYICELIRNDSVEEFIRYVNQNNYPLESLVNPSIYETNPLLLSKKITFFSKENEPSLIEYATFFGAIQIFQYLSNNGVKLNSYLWTYAIYSQNPEIIHILEENNKHPIKSYYSCFKDAILCHHNNIASYILNNYLPNESEFTHDIFIHALKTHNFAFIENDLINETALFELCKYDYYHFVEFVLKDKDIDNNIIKTFDDDLFYFAVEKEDIDLIQLLMSNDYNDINFECDNRTALNLAVEKENIEIVKLLLKNERIDINALDKQNAIQII